MEVKLIKQSKMTLKPEKSGCSCGTPHIDRLSGRDQAGKYVTFTTQSLAQILDCWPIKNQKVIVTIEVFEGEEDVGQA